MSFFCKSGLFALLVACIIDTQFSVPADLSNDLKTKIAEVSNSYGDNADSATSPPTYEPGSDAESVEFSESSSSHKLCSIVDPDSTKKSIALCLRGLPGAPNVSSALFAKVIRPLQEAGNGLDVFVVSPTGTEKQLAEVDDFFQRLWQASSGSLGTTNANLNSDPSDLETYLTSLASDGLGWQTSGIRDVPGTFFCPVNRMGPSPNQDRLSCGHFGRWATGFLYSISNTRCADLIEHSEREKQCKYDSVIISRLDNMWLGEHPTEEPHPPDGKEGRFGCWIPGQRQDNLGGVCDMHAWCDRTSAETYMRGQCNSIANATERKKMLSWLHSVLIPHFASIGSPPHFGSEAHLHWALQTNQVHISREGSFGRTPFRSCDCSLGKECPGNCQFMAPLGMWGKLVPQTADEVFGKAFKELFGEP